VGRESRDGIQLRRLERMGTEREKTHAA